MVPSLDWMNSDGRRWISAVRAFQGHKETGQYWSEPCGIAPKGGHKALASIQPWCLWNNPPSAGCWLISTERTPWPVRRHRSQRRRTTSAAITSAGHQEGALFSATQWPLRQPHVTPRFTYDAGACRPLSGHIWINYSFYSRLPLAPSYSTVFIIYFCYSPFFPFYSMLRSVEPKREAARSTETPTEEMMHRETLWNLLEAGERCFYYSPAFTGWFFSRYSDGSLFIASKSGTAQLWQGRVVFTAPKYVNVIFFPSRWIRVWLLGPTPERE